MSDEIKVTVIAEEEPMRILLSEPPVIKVSLYPVTVAHPSVFEAANRAESSADSAQHALEQAQSAAQAAIDAANSISSQVIDSINGDEHDKAPSVHATKTYIDQASDKVIDSMAGAETTKAPSVQAVKTYVAGPLQLVIDLSNGTLQVGNFRFKEVSGELQIQKFVGAVWTPITGFNQ